ncbi:NADH-quinone oxidoreductase subunit NuoG [Microbulbifer guangxiensis]|uniref:NADH-quinone oxidoreductase subunit NuoG n=1 Tax=Microbulbifer guangxiensis TaxID=2904249 RepID=UPI001EFF757C|nr:NADH-quinone oxidoreductase subunit NuoG [Microbulbifer guangxiensis]
MLTITIDGEECEAEAGQNLLSICLARGIDLPYFCWHPAMGSVGACRQCAVIEHKDEQDQQGQLVMSCMTAIRDGGRYSVDAHAAREFRGGIIENLMTNHPHDCPVCEEGGECHLQDMTEMTGHTVRRYRGPKRTHRNQYLGPFINHEMNRCIACYRCTRYYRDYAGGSDLEALGRNNQVYFGRHEDGRLLNGFSGNLVEVCPTGVFTDKTFSRHYVRKWDQQMAPSICEHCGVGCNTAPAARQPGRPGDPWLRRVTNLYNRDINGYFLCDRGRFGYEYANSPARLSQVLERDNVDVIGSSAGEGVLSHREIPPGEGVEAFARHLEDQGPGKHLLLGIGSPRSSLENNFALRTLAGAEHFYAGLGATDLQLLRLVDTIQRDDRIRSATTPEIEQADAILILGEDIDNTAPRVALAVRQAALNHRRQRAAELKIPDWQDAAVRQLPAPPVPIIFVGWEIPPLADCCTNQMIGTPEILVSFAEAVLATIRKGSGDKDILPAGTEASQDSDIGEVATETAQALAAAKRPLVIAGCGARQPGLLRAAGLIATALAEKKGNAVNTYLACPEVNSLGLVQLLASGDMHLERLQGIVTEARQKGTAVTLVVLENDLSRRLERSQARNLLAEADTVIALDHLPNDTTRRAHLVFPTAATPECQGSVVNSTGRVQRHYGVYEGIGFIQEGWRWLADALSASNQHSDSADQIRSWQHCDDVIRTLAETLPVFSKLPAVSVTVPEGFLVARQSHRASGRTAIGSARHVAELPPPEDTDAPLSYSMEGIHDPAASTLQAMIRAPGWTSNQSIHQFLHGINGPRIGRPEPVTLQRTTAPLPHWQSVELHGSRHQPGENKDAKGLLAIPLYRLIGSGELSNSAEGIASVMTEAFAKIHPADAAALDINQGDEIQLSLGETSLQLQSQLDFEIAPGVIGLPCGLPKFGDIAALLPSQARIIRVIRYGQKMEGDDC